MRVLFAAMLFLLSCAQVDTKSRFPASILKDVGVIDERGDILLFYKSGEYIIVKSCSPLALEGLAPAEARQKCQGKSNRVPLESFKEAIRNLISLDRLDVLRPFTPEEVQIALDPSEDISDSELKFYQSTIDDIKAFAQLFGHEESLLADTDADEKLKFNQTREELRENLNAEVEKAIDLVVNDSVLALTRAQNDRDQLLYTVLKNFDPKAKFPCGLKGSIEARIEDCSDQASSGNGQFRLVTRTKDFHEVFKDLESGLIWSDRLATSMSYTMALGACANGDSADSGGLEVAWRLPNKKEFDRAEKLGIRLVLPNMNYNFWTANKQHTKKSSILIFKGHMGGFVKVDHSVQSASVRCVGN